MKRIACMVTVFCMITLWVVAAASAAGTYSCRCKGIKEWVFLWYAYGDCGNGFVGGDKGQVTNNIAEGSLGSYIPPGVSGQVISGTASCGYYPDSGWNCGKMAGGTPPNCIYD
ncbi:MAG: hypothetical protein JW943_10795 [Deltaproteobacteria bacterium]|nr:hypothetical protein [Deltaproteobacteria bacterium]